MDRLEPDGDEDEDDAELDAPARGPEPDLFDIEELASAFQLDRPRERGHDAEAVDELDLAEVEELVDDAEADDEGTEPRCLYLLVDGAVHTVDKNRFVIGRVSSQCDLTIIDANVSRQHCAIERRDGRYFVTDLGSTNGVVVDGRRVDDYLIEPGDVLVLSGRRIQCSFEPPALAAKLETASQVAVTAAARPARQLPSPTAITGQMPAVPPAGEPEPAPPEQAPAPMTFEARVESRLAEMAVELTSLRAAMQQLVTHIESLEGVNALAQVIQKRLQQAKRAK